MTVTVVGATACGLVLASLLGITIVHYHRQKKRLKRRQHQLLRKWSSRPLDIWNAVLQCQEFSYSFLILQLVDWKPVSRVCQTDHEKQHLSISVEKDMKGNCNAAGDLAASAPVSILLLYRRDDLQVARRAVQLRNKLQSECGSQVKVIHSHSICCCCAVFYIGFAPRCIISGLRLWRREPVGGYRPRRFGLAAEANIQGPVECQRFH